MSENFKPLRKPRPEGEDQIGNGILRIIRDYKKGGKVVTYANGGKQAEVDLAPGIVAEGIYEGTKESPLEGGDVRIEHCIREQDGTLVLVRSTTLLADDEAGLSAVGEGEKVRLEFLGMKQAKSGRKFANFRVSTVQAADAQ